MNKENSREPIAIVGIGCRFPGGASSPKAFWELLARGEDAIVDVPPDRWDWRRFYDPNPDKAGKTYTRQGGFLRERLEQFDPLFFGISPREARTLDPQQRLLLEVTWEAVEDAGLTGEKLAGSDTGVFVGAFALDMKMLQASPMNRDLLSSSSATGASMTLLSNRISYAFDWRGPSISIDTACSSSLVALHYACQSLWNNECSMALAGGSNTMLRPEYFVVMSKGHYLSPSSRCQTFDARADGYARGEGAGVALLKPLAAALADGDPIYALIRATGVNQDGQTPGISVPSRQSQERLIRQVYAQAGVRPDQVNYVEAHGTGTKLGDPIEAGAINAAVSPGRNGGKCVVGSVKTNIGHLEAAAGIAGLIKTALALRHKAIPPNLHFKTPNPEIPFADMSIRVPTSLEPWPETRGEKAFAGVNSFGYGGTNAHVLLEEAPARTNRPAPENNDFTRPCLFPLSARSAAAVKDLARLYGGFLAGSEPPVSLPDFFHSAARRRTHHDYRSAIVAGTRAELLQSLQALASGEDAAGVVSGVALPKERRKLAFVYTGMGPQWWGMGRELLRTEPVFRKTFAACDQIFAGLAGWSLIEVLGLPEEKSRIGETEVAQPANVALQLALTALWRSRGIEPDAVVGHSIGEVAAACVAGVLSPEEALCVSYHRSRLQGTRAGAGGMLAAALSEQDALELIQPEAGSVSIAAVNSPSSVTLAGNKEALRRLAAILESRGLFHRELRVDVPYHSSAMDPLRVELLDSLSRLAPRAATLPLYSSVTGTRADSAGWDAEYWWRNMREPVRFAAAARALAAAGHHLFLEVGPHPALRQSIKETVKAEKAECVVIASLHREKPETRQMLESLGLCYTLGLSPRWESVIPAGGSPVPLPGYPWQREEYWHESSASKQDRLGQTGHVMLHQDLRLPLPAWEIEVNPHFFPYLRDHCIDGRMVFPGAGYVEAGLAVFSRVFPRLPARILEEINFHKMLILDEKEVRTLQLRFQPQSGTFAVLSRAKDEGSEWTLHAEGKLIAAKAPSLAPVDLSAIQARCPDVFEIGAYAEGGIHYGPFFQVIRKVWRGTGEMLCLLEGHETLDGPESSYFLHPTLLDGGFQGIIAIHDPSNAAQFVPVSIGRITVYAPPGRRCWALCRIIEFTGDQLTGEIQIYDEDGRVLVEAKELRSKALLHQKEQKENPKQWLYEFEWEPVDAPAPAAKEAGTVMVFGRPGSAAAALQEAFESRNLPCLLVGPGMGWQKLDDRHYLFDWAQPDEWSRFFAEPGPQGASRVVFLGEAEGAPAGAGTGPYEATVNSCAALLHLAQALASNSSGVPKRLCVVTRGGQTVDPSLEGPCELSGGALWGMSRVIRSECPQMMCRLIDLDPASPTDQAGLLADWVATDSLELEVAFRSSRAFGHRLNLASLGAGEAAVEARTGSTREPLTLEIGTVGRMDSLRYRETGRTKPGPGEIELRVHTAALNFKDVLKVMGTLSARIIEGTYFGDSFGMECSGVVVAVGEGAENFKVGDEVVATTNTGCFRSYLTSPTTYVVPKPKSLTMAEAPVFTVYLTAYHALVKVARLQKGESVLIHNAAGGVGLAAVQIARSIGAEIFATAGNDEKRAHLRALGVPHVMDSRTLKFADDIRGITKNRGIDVVLNAAFGETLFKSFELLAPFGRFVEIGKKDIDENSGLPMRAFNRNLSFSAIDLDRIFKDRIELGRELFREVCALFDTGELKALPVQLFPAREAEQAFRFMAQSRQIGKVMLNFEDQEVPVLPGAEKKTVIRNDASYLITGGTRGFGLEIAKWLAAQGARHLVLASRSGAASPDSVDTIAALRGHGVEVLVEAVDFADSGQVLRLMEKISTTLPPLKGIIHGAMVLDDALIENLDRNRLATVMAPKVLGALNLDEHTRECSPDFFVLLSSVSSIVGNRGQANYAAANGFLDGFARHRRALGRAACAVNWGPLAQVGVAARNKKVEQMLNSSGIHSIPVEQALEALAFILERNPAQVGVLKVDWKQWVAANPAGAALPVFKKIVARQATGLDDTAREKQLRLVQELSALSEPKRREHVQALLAAELAKVLQMKDSAQKLDLNQDILKLGIDSLMVVELTTALQSELGFTVSAMDLMRGVSVSRMADMVLEKLGPSFETKGGSPSAPPPPVRPERRPFIDDARLDPALQPAGPKPAPASVQNVLLTGATGFLGAHLLHDLCRFTKATIYCLVRAATPEAALARIRENYHLYFNTALPVNRIVPLPGDLEKPGLGLPEGLLEDLSRRIDAIYHNGAHLNHVFPYERLRAANVSSTLEIIRLAARLRPKIIHHVSTLVAAVDRGPDGSMLEQTPSADPAELFGGYAQTKWTSEKLLAQAHDRGFAVRLFRPAFISGRSDTGAWSVAHDHLLKLLKGCLQMGCAPDGQFRVDMTPVDFVSEAIVRISLQPWDALGPVFNLSNPATSTWTELLGWLNESGFGLDIVPVEVWRERLRQVDAGNELYAVSPLYLEGDDFAQRELLLSKLGSVRRENTLAALRRLGLSYPEITKSLWETYLQHMQRSRFLPPPPGLLPRALALEEAR